MPLLRGQNPKSQVGTPTFVPSQSPHCTAQQSSSVYTSRTQLRAGPPELHSDAQIFMGPLLPQNPFAYALALELSVPLQLHQTH